VAGHRATAHLGYGRAPAHVRTSDIFTETKKQSPNTGARANNTLHK